MKNTIDKNTKESLPKILGKTLVSVSMKTDGSGTNLILTFEDYLTGERFLLKGETGTYQDLNLSIRCIKKAKPSFLKKNLVRLRLWKK